MGGNSRAIIGRGRYDIVLNSDNLAFELYVAPIIEDLQLS